MRKFLTVVIGGTLAGTLLTAQLTMPLFGKEVTNSTSIYEQLDLFGNIFERIKSAYVEEVDEQELIQSAINGMLTSLDPHSSYLAPDEFSSMQVQTRGEFGGLGIEVTKEDGYVKVVSPIDGTPADAAGVEAGDLITHVDGQSTSSMNLDEAVKLMRGKIGSEIVITIAREGTDELFDITIIRDIIRVKATKARIEGDSVVLRITTFSDQTFVNLKSGIKEKVEEIGGIGEVNGFVIDLRNNPGGLLNQAILVSDAFLERGEIVSTRGRNDQDVGRFNAQPGDLAQGKPIVVLINGGSASASEIVAGALQDHRRAVIVGTKSFGKGSVQTVIPLKGDGAMRLTTARYFTPSGRSIQAQGVSPDIVVERRSPIEVAAEEDRRQRFEADLPGSLSNDSLTDEQIKERAEEDKKAELRNQDSQLAYAVDVLKGFAVLGQTD